MHSSQLREGAQFAISENQLTRRAKQAHDGIIERCDTREVPDKSSAVRWYNALWDDSQRPEFRTRSKSAATTQRDPSWTREGCG